MGTLSFLTDNKEILVLFALFFIIVEIIKGSGVIWGFLAPKILGIKTEFTRRKELEELTRKNAEQIELFVKQSGDAIGKAVENIGSLSNNIENLKQDVETKFSSVEVNMATLSDTVQDMQLEHIRNTILNFGAGAGNGRVYSKEQYEYIKKIYNIYHDIIERTGKSNDEIDITYFKIIMPAYEKHIKQRDFLEYMLENKKVNNAISNNIEQANKKPAPKKRSNRKPKTTEVKEEETKE